MKRFLLTALFVLLALPVFAQTIPARPDTYIADNAGILSPGARTNLAQALHDYQTRTTNEFAVLIVPNLGDFGSIEELANKTFHAWGIGKKDKNNGLLLAVSMAEHKYRLEIGYGLEGDLPDARAGQILRDTIPNNFRAGRFDAGITDSVTAVIAHLDAKTVEPAPALGDPTNGVNWFLVILFITIPSIILLFVLHIRKANREAEEEAERARKRTAKDEFWTRTPYTPTIREHAPEKRTYVPVPVIVPVERHDSPSYSSPSSDSYSSPSIDMGSSFGGGDSGGGGASGSW